MRIAYLSEVRVPSRAASLVHVVKMCEALQKHGHDVTLFCATDGNVDLQAVNAAYGVTSRFRYKGMYRSRTRGLAYLYGVKIAWSAWRERVDVVLSRTLMGSVVSGFLGLPVVFEAHMSTKLHGRVSDMLFRCLLSTRSLLGVVVISEALKRHYEDSYELNGIKVRVVPDAASEVSTASVAGLTLSGTDPKVRLNVGYTGHLYEGRGIEVLADIARRCEWLHVHIFGGEPEDAERWRSTTNDVPNITFYGHVDYLKAEGYRQLCDVLVAPYQDRVRVWGNKSDTAAWMSPLKIFEYMASGKAIVSSDLPALREVLRDGENAVLCRHDDVSDWCSALEKLSKDPDYRNSLANNAYKEYLDKYTWDKRAEKIVQELV